MLTQRYNKMKCKKCNEEHNGTFGSGIFCNSSCANSRIKSQASKEKCSKTMKKLFREGKISLPKPRYGKDNHNYKEHGSGRENRKNSLETFDRFQGICQVCKVKLKKEDSGKWHAHHKELLLTEEEYNKTKNRILMCRGCHVTWHNKHSPKRRKLGKMRTI